MLLVQTTTIFDFNIFLYHSIILFLFNFFFCCIQGAFKLSSRNFLYRFISNLKKKENLRGKTHTRTHLFYIYVHFSSSSYDSLSVSSSFDSSAVPLSFDSSTLSLLFDSPRVSPSFVCSN